MPREKPSPGQQGRPSPHSRFTMARRPHVSSISSLVHPHDTSQDSDDPEAQSGVLPDDATLLSASRRPVASRGIVDTRICRSLSSCNVNATPLQEHGHLDSDLKDARQGQLRSLVRGKPYKITCCSSRRAIVPAQASAQGISTSGLRLTNLTAGPRPFGEYCRSAPRPWTELLSRCQRATLAMPAAALWPCGPARQGSPPARVESCAHNVVCPRSQVTRPRSSHAAWPTWAQNLSRGATEPRKRSATS